MLNLICMISKENIFLEDSCIDKFKKKVRSTYESNNEFYFSIIMVIVFIAIFYYFNGFNQISGKIYLAGEEKKLTGIKYLLSLICLILTTIFGSIFVLLVSSAFILYLYGLSWLNKLGKDFKLKIEYENLNSGIFGEIGKFVLKISLPPIILGTFYSILGLYLIYFFNNYTGYLFIGLSLAATLIIVLLLFKNTFNIHKSIVQSKSKMRKEALKDFEETKDLDLTFKYQTRYSINNYLKKINEISNWPFNPSSIKKLIITLSSSGLPIILSLFGFFKY